MRLTNQVSSSAPPERTLQSVRGERIETTSASELVGIRNEIRQSLTERRGRVGLNRGGTAAHLRCFTVAWCTLECAVKATRGDEFGWERVGNQDSKTLVRRDC